MTAAPDAPIRRHFLDWKRPALPEAAGWLVQHYRSGTDLELGGVIVVLPGQRAGRRLLELLACQADDHHLNLTPPDITTEGQLPERLYAPRRPFADDLTQQAAWATALRALPAGQLRLALPHAPPPEEPLAWLELGDVLRRLHVELAADGLSFADVQRLGAALEGFSDGARWQALREIQDLYHRTLTDQGLWDRQTARLTAIRQHEIHTDRQVVLIGTVDLNGALRQMLQHIAGSVTALVVAPAERAGDFDPFGCLLPPRWCEAEIPLRGEQIRQLDGPAEQAEAVAEWLSELGGRLGAEDVVIGAPDESFVPQVQRRLAQSQVRTRWVGGARLGETAPFRLLAAAVRFAGPRRYDDLAALLRHPDVEDWHGAGGLLNELDEYYNERLPNRVPAGSGASLGGRWPKLASALAQIDRWLKPAATERPLCRWGTVFRDLLAEIYGERELRLDVAPDAALFQSILRLRDACQALEQLNPQLGAATLTAADAFHVALSPLARESLPPPSETGAIDILGWLELPLDDAGALVVTSFNEEFLPQAAGYDAFLPDRLRRHLQLLHGERRYARDAYAATVLACSRRHLQILFARRNSQGDPLRPSRLLFACADAELIRRAQDYFRSKRTPAPTRRLLLATGGPIPAQSAFRVPPIVRRGRPVQEISVTQFKDFLACSYRYYLHHVRELRAIDDSARELDGGAFGSLVHKALGAFGRDPEAPRRSTRAADIAAFLESTLNKLADQRYGGKRTRPAIAIQIEQARRRLLAFASKQAELAGDGWVTIFCESDERLCTRFDVDDQEVVLCGRIDRIDFHESLRQLRIVDYKTADRASKPDETHRRKDEWIDLQLPLYRHLVPAALPEPTRFETVQLCYFNLPKSPGETAVVAATWDDALLASADETARAVIRRLRAEDFGTPEYPAPLFGEQFAAICLDHARARPTLQDDEGGE